MKSTGLVPTASVHFEHAHGPIAAASQFPC